MSRVGDSPKANKAAPAASKEVAGLPVDPAVATITVRATQVGRGTRPDNDQYDQMIYPGNFREKFACANPLCFGGGIGIGSIVREMVEKRETSRVAPRIHCGGHEGTALRIDNPCMNHWRAVTVNVTFKAV